jgi:hypothetical protein
MTAVLSETSRVIQSTALKFEIRSTQLTGKIKREKA